MSSTCLQLALYGQGATLSSPMWEDRVFGLIKRAPKLTSFWVAPLVSPSRVVSVAEGKAMAAKIKAPFVETSARKNANIRTSTSNDFVLLSCELAAPSSPVG